jgi:hypothetical protein
MEKQTISKKRVADHGEVFTSKREVNAMLDLVKQETERIDSRFLEPACGTGNFLTEILERKLQVVEKRYCKSQFEFERNLILAVSSIYGIDIQDDNVIECRKRLFDIVDKRYTQLFDKEATDDVRKVVKFILEKNIIWGDALTLKTVGAEPQPISFPEWSFINGIQIKRRDFAFRELIEHSSMRELPLFSDVGEKVFIPSPVREYLPVHFLKLGQQGD